MNGNCPALLRQIMELGFTAFELRLFLDTHPENREALRDYCKVNEKLSPIMEEYERVCRPLDASRAGKDTDCWNWIDDPWPWEMCY